MASSLVLGTAGHIDHGKSALVKALTGTDPDRLPEEKQRGVTIELGFARLELPSGRAMSVVDVPGHERFVRQMVAGATGIDVVLLVVAADDGVMPQTREHLAIIDLLGIERGVVALTKSDLVDAEWLELVRADVRQLLEGSSIAAAPIVAVSARTGAGLPELRAAIDAVAATTVSRHVDLPARLPVDRVFTVAGAGTVVTGTLWSGTVRPGDAVELYPSRRRARVRGVQVHSAPAEAAFAGSRVALNLAGIEKDDVSRGDIVAAPGSLGVTDRFDARFVYLAGNTAPFESGTRVHVHHGTREVLGRVLLMDAERLEGGGQGLAQVRLEEPLSPRYGDRFIVRSYSPVATIGGGMVLDAAPPRRTALRAHERELLEALSARDIDAAAVGLLAARGLPMTAAQVADALGAPLAGVAAALAAAPLARIAVAGEPCFLPAAAERALLSAIERELLAFHAAEPTATGIATLALRDRVDRRLSPRVFDALLALAADRGIAVLAGGEVRHPRAAVSALAEEAAARDALLALLTEQGLAPASVDELAAAVGVSAAVARKALGTLLSQGALVRLGGDRYFAAAAVAEAREKVVAYLREHGEMLAKDARDLTGTTRRYIVPLLEHFDAQGITRRDGDVRTLGRRGQGDRDA